MMLRNKGLPEGLFLVRDKDDSGRCFVLSTVFKARLLFCPGGAPLRLIALPT